MMNSIQPFLIEQYDQEIIQMITNKYGYEAKIALRKFIFSKTHKMLATPELEMWDFIPRDIFDMWEVEQITGDPRNSIYIRGDY